MKLSRILASIDPTKIFPGVEPIEGETLLADGWVYRDIPGKLAPDAWDLLVGTIGEGNYRLLAYSEGTTRLGDPWKRGQMMISPAGMENLKRYAAENPPPPAGG